MNDESLARLITKARMLRELHRARTRVRQLEPRLCGETAEVEEEPEIPAFLTRAHPAETISAAPGADVEARIRRASARITI